MERQKIAVIGSGISGLSAAWLLAKHHQVTLYEADGRLGGHANTIDVDTPEGQVPIDTGFIVYNVGNYTNLTALFAHLDVPTYETEMTFALSLDEHRYEYSGTGANGFFGQRRNFFRPHHWKLLADVNRFFLSARQRVSRYDAGISLGAFLAAENYRDAFVNDHILPMGAAIWSTSMQGMLEFPARSFVDFYDNHGLLNFIRRPVWRSVRGGSRTYIQKIIADSDIEVVTGNKVQKISRHPGYVHITDGRGAMRPFDQVVVASHADQALAMLEEPSALEHDILSAFSYQRNVAILHNDPRWMPKRKRLWSSWNYLKRGDGCESDLCVTYWMNELQALDTKSNFFVTLNPFDEIHPKAVSATCAYDHPVFNAEAIAAQQRIGAIQGTNRTWFCGAHLGYGFHEDGIQSGLAVAEAIGGVARPWTVDNPSGRLAYFTSSPREAAE